MLLFGLALVLMMLSARRAVAREASRKRELASQR